MRVWKPCVIWLTGFSGSGKTTLAEYLKEVLRGHRQMTVVLDGDVIRDLYGRKGFDRESRLENIRQVSELSAVLEMLGVTAIVALISPYQQAREDARTRCRNFFEVHVATPLNVCERRDPKGLYACVRRGELKGFTGIDDPYETPVNPDLKIDTSTRTVTSCATDILNYCFSKFNR